MHALLPLLAACRYLVKYFGVIIQKSPKLTWKIHGCIQVDRLIDGCIQVDRLIARIVQLLSVFEFVYTDL
jgi:hypothetical protein